MNSEEKVQQPRTKDLIYLMISMVIMVIIATGLGILTHTEPQSLTSEPVFHGRLFILSFI